MRPNDDDEPARDEAEHEARRQRALEALGVLDTPDERAYDDLTRLAAARLGAPIALISLVDGRRQWFKSRVGLQVQETPREYSFCSVAIRNPGNVMQIGDAAADARFRNNPLVTGEPRIRAYLGVPLRTRSGDAVGTLCVIDRVERTFDARQIEELKFLADQVVNALEAGAPTA